MGQATTTSASPPPSIESLISMGFSQEAAQNALSITSNNFDSALQLLIDQKQAEERNKRSNAINQRHQSKSSQPRTLPTKSNPVPSSSTKSNPMPSSTKSNPIPSKNQTQNINMKNIDFVKELEDQPEAVDTLYYVLNTILNNPNEIKYRSLKVTNARFSELFTKDVKLFKTVENFLTISIGFEKTGEYFTLPPNYSIEKLTQGKELLEMIQKTSKLYQVVKTELEFQRVLSMSQETATKEENERRLQFSKKLPPVPELGAGGTTRISVFLSQGSNPLFRCFSSDDTLRDVIHFIASQRSLIGQKLLDQTWVLMDETLLEKRKLIDFDRTLYALNLWPSATLHVRLK